MNDDHGIEENKGRILLVDDTPANLRLLSRLLQDQGYQVHAASNGRAVFPFCQATPPDLILLDIRMPDMDGYQVCERLKADPRTCDIPVIFLSAAGEAPDKVKAFSCGGVDYVVKPFQEEEVLARVGTRLSLRDLQRRLAAQNVRLREEGDRLRRAADDIRHLMAEQQSIFDNVGVGIAFLKDGAITRCNRMFAATFGYRIDELAGIPPALLHASEDAYRHWESALGAAVETGKSLADDAQYRRRDGALFWVSATLTAIDRTDPAKGVIWVVHDIDRRKRAEERVRHLAQHDGLTHLAKRELLLERIAAAIDGAAGGQNRFALAFLDLDRFKSINDSLGHDAGDALLRTVAARLLDCVRESDTVARLGGDEFAILLHDGYAASGALPPVRRIAERIIERIGQPVELAGAAHSVSCSIGISVFPEDGADAETLLKHADAAMYRAKQGGRNGFRFFTPPAADSG